MHRINRINSIKTLKLRLYYTTFIRKKNAIVRSYYSNPKIKIDFPKLSQTILKRSLNQDTNAAGVWDPFPDPFQPIVEKSAETALDEDNDPKQKKKNPTSSDQKTKRPILSPRVMDAVLTTVMGLAAVGLGGVFYQAWYEWNEVHKVKMAFKKPLATLRDLDLFEERNEYQTIREAIKGNVRGKYFLLVGERGTGKTQLIFRAMAENKQENVVFAEAHSDSEIFKCRLGKALQYTYREDYIGQLFAREAPERGSALLDVEKALNMVEIVAKKRLKKKNPLVLVISNIHAFKDDEDGEDLLELLQQRAESWAASKIVTMVFNTDDYTIYERMKRDASRMEVIRVRELEHEEAANLLIKLINQKKEKQEKQKEKKQEKQKKEMVPVSEDELRTIVKRIGGRFSYINKLARENDIQKAAKQLEDEERNWIINRIGLIPDFEESAFDDQKYASCAWKLIRKIVKSDDQSVSVEEGRRITGNPKWIEMMDHDNIIMIDENQNIKADSKMLQNIFEDIVNKDGFDERLDNVCERVEEVDKEQRTRELIWSRKNDQVVRIGKPKRSWFFW